MGQRDGRRGARANGTSPTTDFSCRIICRPYVQPRRVPAPAEGPTGGTAVLPARFPGVVPSQRFLQYILGTFEMCTTDDFVYLLLRFLPKIIACQDMAYL